MVKVQCLKCGNVQDTYAKWFFSCNKCGEKQTIENSLKETPQTLKQNQEPVSKPVSSPMETGEETPQEEPKEAPQDLEDLEVEEAPEEIKKVDEKASKQEFKCPNCNQPVEEFQDCLNPDCMSEIIWGSDDE